MSNDPMREELKKIAATDEYPDHEDTAAELREIARNALSLPVPVPQDRDAVIEEWQNIDNILDVLEKAGCCRNGHVHAAEDVVANAIRDWLRALKSPPAGEKE